MSNPTNPSQPDAAPDDGNARPQEAAPESALQDVGLHEKIIAIDPADNSTYPIDKLEAHLRNVPHVAISIFLFNDNHLLIQQRAATKYHSAGLWANTVCSHPRWNESPQTCAERRLQEELGCTAELTGFGSIDYNAQVGELHENEHVHCFFGTLANRQLADRFNPVEVAAIDWLTVPQIIEKIETEPNRFTEWFKIYMSTHRSMINSIIS